MGIDAPDSHDIILIKKQGKVAALEDEIQASKLLVISILQFCYI